MRATGEVFSMAPGPPRLLEAVRCQCTLSSPAELPNQAPDCALNLPSQAPDCALNLPLVRAAVCWYFWVIVQVRCAPFPPAPGSLNLNHRYFHRTCSMLSVMLVCPEPVLVNCSVLVRIA